MELAALREAVRSTMRGELAKDSLDTESATAFASWKSLHSASDRLASYEPPVREGACWIAEPSPTRTAL